LAVLSMLSMMLTAGLGERGLAWTRMDRETSAGEATEAVQARLHERIEHIWPNTIYDFMRPRPDFDGSSTWLEFMAPPSAAQGRGPMRRYRLTVDAQGDLTLESISELALTSSGWTERQVLMQGVQAIDLAYFGPTTPGAAPDWHDEWTAQSALPSLVRIRLGFPPGDRRRWPDTVVKPAADIDTECVILAATGGCLGR